LSAVVHDKPVSNFTFTSACPNNQVIVSFTDASTSTDPINFWYYDFDGLGSIAQQNATQPFVNEGNYDIAHIVSTSFGCSDTTFNTVVVDPFPEAGFFFNTTGGLNVGSVFNFIDTSNYAVNWSWTFGEGNTSTIQNPSNTYYENGNYIVTLLVENNLGCVDSVSKNIIINTITDEITQLIPTIISPNGDGLNDVWKLGFIELLFPNAEIQIFNEWGQELFTSVGYTEPWDGTYDGEPVPDGNYFYVIDLKASVDPSLFKGVLMVLRKGE
jgi:gliding motility-associated-like protein